MYLSDTSLSRSSAPVHRKLVRPSIGGGLRVYLDADVRPFARLAKQDLLDSTDVCRLFSCSARSLYRWVGEGLLRPSVKIGREYLFTKAELLRWWDERPHAGRPPKS